MHIVFCNENHDPDVCSILLGSVGISLNYGTEVEISQFRSAPESAAEL